MNYLIDTRDEVTLNAGAVAVLTVQMLACGFFPGANRGFNLPWHIVGFMPWSYKGLLQSEFLYRKPTTWDCPTGEGLEVCFYYFAWLCHIHDKSLALDEGRKSAPQPTISQSALLPAGACEQAC